MPRFAKSMVTLRLSQLHKSYEGAALSICRAAIMETAEAIVRDTPVDTGYLRGSWVPSIGQAPQLRDGRTDPGGGAALADLGVKLSGMRLGDVFWFANSAAYARRIEYGFTGTDSLGRSFDQRGRFFVRDNVRRIPRTVAAKAEQLAKAALK